MSFDWSKTCGVLGCRLPQDPNYTNEASVRPWCSIHGEHYAEDKRRWAATRKRLREAHEKAGLLYDLEPRT